MPKYSIIVSVYNIQEYLRQCIDSIVGQTVTDFELILVDDGSKDGSEVICDEYAKMDPRVIVLHKDNGGLSDARNCGLNAAKGKWVYFVDGDDWLQPSTLEEFDNIINDHHDVDFIHGRYTIYYTKTGKTELISNYIDNEWAIGKTGQEVFAEAYKRNLPVAMGIRGVYNRNFLIKNNLYFAKGLYAEDEEWTPRLFYYANRLCGCAGGGYTYRANRVGSLMNTLNLKKLLDLISIYVGWFEFLSKNKCIKEYIDTLTNEGYKRTAWAFVSAVNSLDRNDFKKFVSVLKKNSFLIGKWSDYINEATFYKLSYSVSSKSPSFGYFFYHFSKILKKFISKTVVLSKKIIKIFVRLFFPPVLIKVFKLFKRATQPVYSTIDRISHVNQTLYILGNGPSLSCSINAIKNKIVENDCMAVNNFCNTELFSEIKPCYYVIADPSNLGQLYNLSDALAMETKKIAENLNKISWDINLIVPDFAKKGYLINCLKTNPLIKIYYYNTKNRARCSDLFKNWAGNYIAPPSQTVLNTCVYLGVYLHYSEINILGMDMSWHEDLELDQKTNRLFIIDKHFYGTKKRFATLDVNGVKPALVHEYLQCSVNALKSFWDLRHFADFNKVKVYNLSNHSWVDAFERKEY